MSSQNTFVLLLASHTGFGKSHGTGFENMIANMKSKIATGSTGQVSNFRAWASYYSPVMHWQIATHLCPFQAEELGGRLAEVVGAD